MSNNKRVRRARQYATVSITTKPPRPTPGFAAYLTCAAPWMHTRASMALASRTHTTRRAAHRHRNVHYTCRAWHSLHAYLCTKNTPTSTCVCVRTAAAGPRRAAGGSSAHHGMGQHAASALGWSVACYRVWWRRFRLLRSDFGPCLLAPPVDFEVGEAAPMLGSAPDVGMGNDVTMDFMGELLRMALQTATTGQQYRMGCLPCVWCAPVRAHCCGVTKVFLHWRAAARPLCIHSQTPGRQAQRCGTCPT